MSMANVGQHIEQRGLQRLAQDGILDVELYVGVWVGILEDVGVVVVVHGLVLHGIDARPLTVLLAFLCQSFGPIGSS